jgi:hypothetical protein
MWRAAFRRWKLLLDNEAFWSRLTARIHALDDPRLTTGTSRRMRESLPLALLSINAQLALRAAQAGNEADVKRQIAVLRDSGFDQKIIGEALHRVVEPLRERIKTMCQFAARDASADARHADATTHRLFEHSCPVLASIDYLLAPGDPVRDGAHDEVALKALEALIPFGRETQDWKTFLELLEEARKIAASTSAVSRIEENLTVLRENLRIDRENRLQGICFFCEERPTEKIFEIEVPMHGNVQHQLVEYNKTRTTWNHNVIRVPRCSVCARIHEQQGDVLQKTVGPALLSCAAYFICLNLFGPLVWEGWGPTACILGGIATWVIPWMIAKSIAHIASQRTRDLNEQYEYFAIQKRSSEGWKLGPEPRLATSVPTADRSPHSPPVLLRWGFFRREAEAGHNVHFRVWGPMLLALTLLVPLVGLTSGPTGTRLLAQMRIISPRSAIARLLPELQGNDALKTFEILKPMLHSPGVDPELAVAALNKALSMGRESSGNEQLSIEAAEEIGSIGPPARAAVPSLELAARDLRSNIGDAAVDALRHVDPERANEWAIANLLTFSSADVRRRAAGVLAKADPAPEKAVPTLLRAAEDSDPAVRDAAKEALSHVAPGLLRRRGLAK